MDWSSTKLGKENGYKCLIVFIYHLEKMLIFGTLPLDSNLIAFTSIPWIENFHFLVR